MTKLVLALACAVALLFAVAEARAAPAAKPEEAAKPQAAEGEGAKTEEGEAAKPEDGAPSAGAENAAAPPPEGDSSPLTLAELTREGFVIRTTNFIPAEAVTRQSGKVSSDAFIVTLQTTTSTAVCFYNAESLCG